MRLCVVLVSVITVLLSGSAAPAAATAAGGGHPAPPATACSTGFRHTHAGDRLRQRTRLDGSVAVLTGRAGRPTIGLARLRHVAVAVIGPGGATRRYRLRPVANTFGPGTVVVGGVCLARVIGSASPVAVVVTTSAYNQCCIDITVFGARARTRSVLHAGTAGASLVSRHRGAAIRSSNPAFTARFTDFADSDRPLELFTVRNGRLVNATQSFPRAVRRDTRYQWRQFRHPRNGPGHGLGALAAWVADKYVLQHGAAAWRRVHRLLCHGRLRGVSGWSHGRAYVRDLRRFLIQTGYAS